MLLFSTMAMKSGTSNLLLRPALGRGLLMMSCINLGIMTLLLYNRGQKEKSMSATIQNCQGRLKPGAIIIPLHDKRDLGIIVDKMPTDVTISKGEFMYVAGDTVHQGKTTPLPIGPTAQLPLPVLISCRILYMCTITGSCTI